MDELASWLRQRMRLEAVPAGRTLGLVPEELFGLLEGVVEVEGRLLEGPALVNADGLALERPIGLPGLEEEVLLVQARTSCVWGRLARAELGRRVDEAGLLQLQQTRAELRRRLRGLDDFLDPRDASIPAGAFGGEVDMVLLVVRGPEVDEELEELGLRPIPRFAERRLLVLAHYPGIGGGGRSTSYDEVAEFLPCLDGAKPALFARRIHVNSFAAALVGRELFGFPKQVAPVGLGERSAWAQDFAALTWSGEEQVDELDRLGVGLLAQLLDLGGGVLERLSDLVAEALELDPLVRALTLTRLPLVMPDGRRAWMRLAEPRRARRLLDPVLECAGLGRLMAGWRLSLDMELEAPEGLPQAAPAPPRPTLEVVQTELWVDHNPDPGDPTELANELRLRAGRQVHLEPGERRRLPSDMVLMLESGSVLVHALEDDGPVLEGLFRSGDLVGWLGDGLVRELEGVEASMLLLVPLDMVQAWAGPTGGAR